MGIGKPLPILKVNKIKGSIVSLNKDCCFVLVCFFFLFTCFVSSKS